MSLLSETPTEWAADANGEFEWLPVCFDPIVQGRRGETEDEWVASVSDLGFLVTTGPDTIAAFLWRRERMVVFSTYQSSAQIAGANR